MGENELSDGGEDGGGEERKDVGARQVLEGPGQAGVVEHGGGGGGGGGGSGVIEGGERGAESRKLDLWREKLRRERGRLSHGVIE